MCSSEIEFSPRSSFNQVETLISIVTQQLKFEISQFKVAKNKKISGEPLKHEMGMIESYFVSSSEVFYDYF